MAAKYSLTPDHSAQLKPWSDRWIANAMSTSPMTADDREQCRIAVEQMYALAGKPVPRVVFVPSPFVARFASGFAAAIWWHRANPNSQLSATLDATSAATLAATEAATLDATSDATLDATRAATHAATEAATSAATLAATSDATLDATEAATSADDLSTWYHVPDMDRIMHYGETISPIALACARDAWRFYQGGNMWSGWASFLSFFRHVVKLPNVDWSKWAPYEELAIRSGFRFVHERFCIISDRPELLLVDAENRPHCTTGPYCRWRDGSSLYAVHGVRVPAYVIEHPQRITVADIDLETNAEVRRVKIDQYGPARYLADAGAVEVHRDDFGVLRRREVPGDEPIVMVQVVNSTPEPDGSFKDYFLRVNPECRPMLDSGKFGEPQQLTARNAIASTFGLRGEEYEPAFQS